MIFVFKILGAYIGYKFAGTPGVIAGLIIGHSIDAGLQVKLQRHRARKYFEARVQAETNQQFFVSLFSMLAKLVAVDHSLSKQELQAVESIIKNILKLDRKRKKLALQIFHEALNANRTFAFYAAQFQEAFSQKSTMFENVLDTLIKVAISDGPLNKAEEQLLRSATHIFQVPEENYAKLLHMNGVVRESTTNQHSTKQKATNAETKPLNKPSPYTTLGCKESDSAETIKKTYRKLVQDYHPDKIVSKELPEDFLRFAQQKFREIQSAYDAIRRERGIEH